MSIRLTAWNANEGLAQAKQMPQIVERVKELESDVVILPDAFSLLNEKHGSQPEVLDEAKAAFLSLGYVMSAAEYGRADDWHHDRNMLVLSRLTSHFRPAQYGTRVTLSGYVEDPDTKVPVRIDPYHGDDRSAAARRRNTDNYLETLEGGVPVVRAGDFNEVHHKGLLVRALGTSAARSAVHAIPQWERHLRRAHSLGTRLVTMTSDWSLIMLSEYGFTDADPTRQGTLGPFQLDHFMGRDLRVTDFAVGRRTKASDHRDISVVLHT